MIARRDLLIGSSCVLAAGAAYALTPRRFVSLFDRGKNLGKILPAQFKGWSSRDVSDVFVPTAEDSLAARLYQDTVGRLFQNSATGSQVLMLMVHGDVQSNELQLHRPEVCYPAFGFQIVSSVPIDLSLSGDVSLPARKLVARSAQSQLATIYWTRLGEYLPTSGTEQRFDRLKAAMDGFVPDGLLARFSMEGDDIKEAMTTIADLISELIIAVSPDYRRSLIGTSRAKALQNVV